MVEELEKFRVKNAPKSIYYIPNFINDVEEEYLMTTMANCPLPKWEILSHRRLINFGGDIRGDKLIPSNDFPPKLQSLMDKVDALRVLPKASNHVLVNEYTPGQGIMPHTDGPAFHPLVANVTLGSHTLLDLYLPVDETTPKSLEDRAVGSVLLEPKSLFLMTDQAYSNHLHGIREVESDVIDETIFNPGDHQMGEKLERKTRISITIRHIPKIAKLNMGSILQRRK